MKSFILTAVVMVLSMSFAFAESGAERPQSPQDEIKMVREFK